MAIFFFYSTRREALHIHDTLENYALYNRLIVTISKFIVEDDKQQLTISLTSNS